MAVHTNGTGAEHISGVVEATNERGVRIAGRWLNVSQFHPVELPRRGESVTVTVDGKGFIRALAPADGVPANGNGQGADRETAITRLAVLKAAAEFCASRPELKSAELFALAERMEAWVTR